MGGATERQLVLRRCREEKSMSIGEGIAMAALFISVAIVLVAILR